MKSPVSLITLLALFILSLSWSHIALTRTELGRWCELRTQSFQIFSDLDEQPLRAVEQQLRRFEVAANSFLPGTEVSNLTPLKIIIFKERGIFRELTGKRKFAGFMQPSLQTNRLLVGPIRGNIMETAQHEYAHYLLRNRREISLPVWFDEGLATLLGNMQFDDQGATIVELPVERMTNHVYSSVNLSHPSRSAARWAGDDLVAIRMLKSILATDTVEDWPQSRINEFYDWSSLLVHYLYFTDVDGESDRRQHLTDYLLAGDASVTTYLDLTHRRLLRALQRHLRSHSQSQQIAVPIPPARIEAAFNCMSETQRDHELAKAVLMQNPEAARLLIEAHLDSADSDADLLVTLSRIELAGGDRAASMKTADRAFEINPTSANTMINLADQQVQDCLFHIDEACRDHWRDATSLYRESIRLDPERFDAVMGLGLAYLYTGKPGEAVNYLKVAYAKAPWAAAINFYLGESYRLIGDSRAETYLTNAHNWAVVEIWRRLAEESLSLLEKSNR